MPDTRSPDVFLQLPADMLFLPAVGHFSKAVFSRYPALQDREDQVAYFLELVVYESCTNVIRHAYEPGQTGLFQLKLWLEPEQVVIHVIDFGRGFDPEAVPPPDLEDPKEGGMGLFIIRQTVDEFSYTTGGRSAGNTMRLVKRF